MNSQLTPSAQLKQLLDTLHQKEITILAHDNIDIDAAISGILLSRFLDFLKIKNTFKILEPVKKNETYSVIKELIGINLKEYEVKPENESEIANLFLVDHYKTSHLGNVVGYIDHHLTSQVIDVDFSYVKNSSATAYLIYELMQEAKYPITKQDILMIVTAMMADTVCFKSTKALPEEIEIAKQLCTNFNLDWNLIESYALCPTPIDKMSLDEIITNGAKQYNFSSSKVTSAYVQISKLPDASTINIWLQRLVFNLSAHNIKMCVFLIFDLANNKTYEYQITEECIAETVHDKIVSRGKDIMPKIEKLFLNARYSLDF